MKARHTKRRTTSPRARRDRAPTRPSVTRPALGGSLAEPPHGHIVCRRCGRIHPLDLDFDDTQLLVNLSARGPRGWTVERIAYSLAAVCPGCAATAAK